MTRTVLAVLSGTVLSTCGATPALAQPCPPYETVAAGLRADYGEVRIAQGLSAAGPWVMEWWVNPETGSWTVVLAMPDGTGCIADAGPDFRMATPGRAA